MPNCFIQSSQSSPTILDYPNDHSKVVWSYDGNIEYWDEKHAPLFAVAVLVLLCLWLPYTFVLLFGQCLQRCNTQSFTARMKPFFDAHCGPFKDRHCYRFGVLLIAWTIPLLVGAFTPLSSSTITPLSHHSCHQYSSYIYIYHEQSSVQEVVCLFF